MSLRSSLQALVSRLEFHESEVDENSLKTVTALNNYRLLRHHINMLAKYVQNVKDLVNAAKLLPELRCIDTMIRVHIQPPDPEPTTGTNVEESRSRSQPRSKSGFEGIAIIQSAWDRVKITEPDLFSADEFEDLKLRAETHLKLQKNAVRLKKFINNLHRLDPATATDAVTSRVSTTAKKGKKPLFPCVHSEILLRQAFIDDDLRFAGEPYIGCSKPACYICHCVLTSHCDHIEPSTHGVVYDVRLPIALCHGESDSVSGTGSAGSGPNTGTVAVWNNILTKISKDILLCLKTYRFDDPPKPGPKHDKSKRNKENDNPRLPSTLFISDDESEFEPPPSAKARRRRSQHPQVKSRAYGLSHSYRAADAEAAAPYYCS